MTKRKTARHVAPGLPPRPGWGDARPPSDLPSPNELRHAARPTEEPAGPGVALLSVSSREPAEHVFRRLLGAYLAGAPGFVVREHPAISPGTREVVRTFCRRTRQPEIVSEELHSLHLHDLSFESPVPLDQRVRRMGRLVLAFHREAVDGWSRLPLADDGYWERQDDAVDREAWYIQRIAALRLGVPGDATELLGSWTAARSLERIADHAVVLATTGPRLAALPQGHGPVTPLRQFHVQAMDHLEGALSARNGERANELLDTGHALVESGHALASRLLPGVGGGVMPPAAAAAVARILESIGRTIAYAQDIAQVGLDRSFPDVPLELPRPTPVSGGGTQRERFLSAPAR